MDLPVKLNNFLLYKDNTEAVLFTFNLSNIGSRQIMEVRGSFELYTNDNVKVKINHGNVIIFNFRRIISPDTSISLQCNISETAIFPLPEYLFIYNFHITEIHFEGGGVFKDFGNAYLYRELIEISQPHI